ncbi:MAG: hypothetical protein FJZ00_14225, partial [Candidatus Sericytochromatia bacterium]|nr:hypothetical protein [Candidatus Tanganyikabacteria bacterium]
MPISGPRPTWQVIKEGYDLESVVINGPAGIPAFFNRKGPQLLDVASGRFARVFMNRRPGRVVRLTVRGRDGAPELKPRLVQQGKSGKGWVLIFDPPERKPVAAAPAPPAIVEPASPVEIAMPPQQLPEEPRPERLPEPPAAAADLEPEYPGRFMLGGRALGLNEVLPDVEGHQPIVAPQPGELPVIVRTLYWRHKVAHTWAAEFDVRWWERYQVVDEPDRTDSHLRDEGWVRAGLSRNLQLFGITQNTFASLELRGVLVNNAKKAIIREYLFANSQWYLSPVVGTQATMPIWGPLAAVAL